MMVYGLVSIITPTWNCAQFICETILAVKAQTYQDWEMIIQDDWIVVLNIFVMKKNVVRLLLGIMH